jgi:hypothetical protein
MTTPHPYRLRPYHNPECIDESKVPAGWRFRYADEIATRPEVCGIHLVCKWIFSRRYNGTDDLITYIVPVAP